MADAMNEVAWCYEHGFGVKKKDKVFLLFISLSGLVLLFLILQHTVVTHIWARHRISPEASE